MGNVWPSATRQVEGQWRSAELEHHLRPQGLVAAGLRREASLWCQTLRVQAAGVPSPLSVLCRWTELPGNDLGVTTPRVMQALGASD